MIIYYADLQACGNLFFVTTLLKIAFLKLLAKAGAAHTVLRPKLEQYQRCKKMRPLVLPLSLCSNPVLNCLVEPNLSPEPKVVNNFIIPVKHGGMVLQSRDWTPLIYII